MDGLQLFWHVLGFAAPAAGLALLMPMLGRVVLGTRRTALMAWWLQMLVQFLAGLAVLAISLALTGHDGQILGYAALVLVAATVQWALLRGWSSARHETEQAPL